MNENHEIFEGSIMPKNSQEIVKSEKPENKAFSTNGGVGVEARDVNADVKATVGVDKVDNSVTVGDNSTLTINNDNSKTVNKNRFDKAIGMGAPNNSPQLDTSAGFER